MARARWRRALALAGILAAIYGLALLVARPRVPDPVTNPYLGQRGGSLAQSAGLEIRYRRGDEIRIVEPSTILQAGDLLEFRVRGERPVYVEVRLRDGTAAPATIFPAGAPASVRLSPGDALPVAPVVGPGGGKLVVTALFSQAARPVGTPADPDTLVTTAVVTKQ